MGEIKKWRKEEGSRTREGKSGIDQGGGMRVIMEEGEEREWPGRDGGERTNKE